MPTPVELFAYIIFGLIGAMAFRWGKKQQQLKVMIVGVLLMVYPYFTPGALALYLVGIALSVALFFVRD